MFILPKPNATLAFFLAFKQCSNEYWETTEIDPRCYGFQIQRGSKWKDGLTDTQLNAFEQAMGFEFPLPLRHFYKTMNGLDKPGMDVQAYSGSPIRYQSVFYSYPDDLDLLKDYIDWILETNQITPKQLKEQGVSRIFPIHLHRFLLIDVPHHPILSMYGSDIIHFSDSLSKLLLKDIFGKSYKLKPLEVPFWLQK